MILPESFFFFTSRKKQSQFQPLQREKNKRIVRVCFVFSIEPLLLILFMCLCPAGSVGSVGFITFYLLTASALLTLNKLAGRKFAGLKESESLSQDISLYASFPLNHRVVKRTGTSRASCFFASSRRSIATGHGGWLIIFESHETERKRPCSWRKASPSCTSLPANVSRTFCHRRVAQIRALCVCIRVLRACVRERVCVFC